MIRFLPSVTPSPGFPFQFIARTRKRAVASLVLASVTLVSLIPMQAAHADTLTDIKKAGVIEVATDMQFPPFDILKGGSYQGFDRDLFDAVAQELGVRPHYINLPWTSILPGLEAKKFDLVIAPVVKNKARASRYAFTAPISEATPAIMKRTDDKSIEKPADIAGKHVGAVKASSILAQLRTYSDVNKLNADIAEYVNVEQSFADLSNGRLDAVSTSLAMLNYVAGQRPDTFKVVNPPYAEPSFFCWVGRPSGDDASLIKAVDAALSKIQDDGRLAAIQKKWFGSSRQLPKKAPEPTT